MNKRYPLLIILIAFAATSMMAQKSNFKDIKTGNVKVDAHKIKPVNLLELSNIEARSVSQDPVKFESINHFHIQKTHPTLKGSYYQNGVPSVIKGKISHKEKGAFSLKAKEYLEASSQQMKINDPSQEFTIVKEWVDDLNHNHVKVQQQYKGIDVFGSEILLHGNMNEVSLLNGKYIPTHQLKEIDTDVKISEQELRKIIMKTFDNYQYEEEITKVLTHLDDFNQWEINQVIYKLDDEFRSAWHVRVHENMGEYHTFFVSTQNGEILKTYQNICQAHKTENYEGAHSNCTHNHDHEASSPKLTKADIVDGPAIANATDLLGITRNINTYEVGNDFILIDASRNMFNAAQSNIPNSAVGVIVTYDANNSFPSSGFKYSNITSSNNSWGNSPEGVSAHFNAGIAYFYFENTHARNSISGAGGTVYSFVNVSDQNGNPNFGNAFWNNEAIWYGNGDSNFKPLARALDVAGHEMSHGVVQATANLEYQGESGALNESFADVFGAMMDRDDWLIGEDVVKTSAFPGGALRNMIDPHNGVGFQDYGRGWQPSHTNEQFLGSQDNGGVHINSGITNHAYYLFATAVGKEKAEKVYYRALTTYLTRSSQFVDARAAVTLAASDLYDNSVVAAANSAFDQVGIGGGGTVPNNYEEDAVVNPGTDLLLFSDVDRSNLFIKEISTGNYLANPLTQTDHISRPSVTDDGSIVVFTGADKKLYFLTIDWNAGTVTEDLIDNNAIWRNVIVSKDGSRIAALMDNKDNTIFVYDYTISEGKTFTLINPTYTNGVSTGDVVFADAMEFDITGDFVVYDALNEISSISSGVIDYWDIGFINVWDSDTGGWGSEEVTKLFTQLPENVSVGNPTFAKNSPYIMAFDYLENSEYNMLGVNIESGDVGQLFTNTDLSWPSYSRDDTKVVHDLPGIFSGADVGVIDLQSDKINPVVNSEGIEEPDARWGVWFSNGDRPLTDIKEVLIEDQRFSIYPNPSSDFINIEMELEEFDDARILVYDMDGKLHISKRVDAFKGKNQWNLKVNNLSTGHYIVKLKHNNKVYAESFIKI